MRPFFAVFAFLALSSVTASPVDLARRQSYTNTQITFFSPEEAGYTACGEIHNDSDMVVALSYQLQGTAYPPAYCGRSVQIVNEGLRDENGNPLTVTATVADTCSDCKSSELELSIGLYELLTGRSVDDGDDMKTVNWSFL